MAQAGSMLSRLLGPKGWLTGADAAPFRRDWLDRHGAEPLGIARPSDTAAVSKVVRICHAAGISVVPQGGNTSLCGGAVAHEPEAVILSLARMARIGEPAPGGATLLVEAGAVLANVHAALADHGLIFPLHLGAEGSATIGGLIGTNAGGSQAFRYGMMQDLVLGLEVVLPDGSIWNGLRAVQKDNAGYQLRKLFCGAEGTLGVVTRAVLRLYPVPRQRATALLVLPHHAAAVALASRLRAEAGEFLSGLEFFCDAGLGFVLEHLDPAGFPLATRGGVYVLVELTCGSEHVRLGDILGATLEWGMEEGLLIDGALAQSDQQRARFWWLREEQPEGQRREGPQLKHDIAVPPHAIADFIETGAAACEAVLAGVRINAFGHLADGNIHYNLSPPEGRADFDGKADAFSQALAELATRMDGSFAAEHGLGRAKVPLAEANRSPVERDLMARIKAAIDPAGTMNPGVLVRALPESEAFQSTEILGFAPPPRRAP